MRFNSYCGIITSPIVTEAVGPQTEYQMPGCCRRESRFVSLTVTTTLMAAERRAPFTPSVMTLRLACRLDRATRYGFHNNADIVH